MRFDAGMTGHELPVVREERPRSYFFRYGLVILSIGIVTFFGYVGFVAFLKDFMPAFTLYSLYLIAIVAGVATFFSPCSFPLLPGYLSFYYRSEQGERGNTAFSRGVLAALGVVSFNIVLGVVIAMLGQGVATTLSISSSNPSLLTRLFRLGIGTILIALGALQLSNVTFHNRTIDTVAKRFSSVAKSGERGLYLYGFGYNLAGIGCAGPIMAGLVVYALGLGGFGIAFLAFVVYSSTMALLMIVLSLLVSKSKFILIDRLKASTPRIKKATSLILLAVGAFLIYATINLQFFIQAFFPK